MGNCIKKESSMAWGGEDWSDDYSPATSVSKNEQKYEYRKIKEVEGEGEGEASITQVKLKITRKQLEEILGKSRNSKGVSVEQVLTHLINVTQEFDQHQHQHQRPWRPALPTITEA